MKMKNRYFVFYFIINFVGKAKNAKKKKEAMEIKK